MNSDNLWGRLAYFAVFYLIFLVIVVIGYPLGQQYAKPIAALIFPINENNSLMKNVIVMSGMYWGMIGVYLFLMKNKGKKGP